MSTLTKKDFQSDQEVRWCPGCGDYAILSSFQTVLADLGIPKEKFVVVSGIGCASRFPYYMNTYGFHTIHGRAPAIATGVKLANPELSVWVVSGDGDALSIGASHLLHAMRRNIDIKVLMFNNRIYGLTKGQASPTSELAKRTKSTPMGSTDAPFNPMALALGANATFVARSVDVIGDHLRGVLHAAAAHRGSTFVEIFQNCNIFNDKAWVSWTDRAVRDDRLVDLVPGEPVVFGSAERRRGIKLDGLDPVLVEFEGDPPADILRWDPSRPDPSLSFLFAHLDQHQDFPLPIGIFRQMGATTYEDRVYGQLDIARQTSGPGDLQALLRSGTTWTVE
ncbi:MAG: 2-oxoacid:ferredoxin oxidoreductase subunit beta [Candidatus Eisenbacteria bacterium]|uniref:2-oxoacid:ferredoxin oxidoreductase subunit beta n=1 Tax=Eiseniibacteriota bacterium TaxID=2212470 RepID=A0A956NBV0_UNCEI|nr:2-oxoacid:ferredoxin oxidoreductase subunit beta [Candidatus Eisenbacteria bacterium]MCB9463340.1 2-oxoacid:ferredoxin oxidoreductase subunit beta [Candidatus Eisenbacteria bacterium]